MSVLYRRSWVSLSGVATPYSLRTGVSIRRVKMRSCNHGYSTTVIGDCMSVKWHSRLTVRMTAITVSNPISSSTRNGVERIQAQTKPKTELIFCTLNSDARSADTSFAWSYDMKWEVSASNLANCTTEVELLSSLDVLIVESDVCYDLLRVDRAIAVPRNRATHSQTASKTTKLTVDRNRLSCRACRMTPWRAKIAARTIRRSYSKDNTRDVKLLLLLFL